MKTNFMGFVVPFVFIFLYGSGFVFTQYGLENSTPMAFLTTRFFLAFVVLLVICMILRPPLPDNFKEFLHISIAGMLTVGTFSIGAFLSISYGISGSLSALVIALQPIIVAFLAIRFLNEKLNKNIFLGLFLGFLGVTFVVYSKISFTSEMILGVFWSIIALLGLSFGNIYQKKYCSNMNLFTGGAIQTFSSTVLVLPFLYFEEVHISWNQEFFVALIYMAIFVSIGALSLLYIMIKNKDVSKVASMFYLVPVSAVIVSYFLFDSGVDFITIVGIITVFVGISIINKK